MKKFRFSLIYILLLLATSPFHLKIANLLLKINGFNFINYLLLGLLLAFMLPALFKAFRFGKKVESAAICLSAAILFYFLFQRNIFLNRSFLSNFLHIAEFFFLGLLLIKENKKVSSPLPYFILFASAFSFELIQIFIHNRVFDRNDIWTNLISGLVGMVAGFF